MRVTGLCLVPTSGWGVELHRHEPQEADDELLLDLVAEKPTGIVLQVVTGLDVAYEDETRHRYERVSILPNGPHGLPVVDAGV